MNLMGLRPTVERELTTHNVTIVMILDHIFRTALQFFYTDVSVLWAFPFVFTGILLGYILYLFFERRFRAPFTWLLCCLCLSFIQYYTSSHRHVFFIPRNFNFRCPYFVSRVSYHGYFFLSCHVCILFCSTEPWILQNVCHSFHFIRLPTGSELKNLINNYHLNNKNNVWSLGPLAADEYPFLFPTFIHKELAQILR